MSQATVAPAALGMGVMTACTLPTATIAMTPGDTPMALIATGLVSPSRCVDSCRLGSRGHMRLAIHDMHTKRVQRRLGGRQ
jgi:hypothetical protein